MRKLMGVRFQGKVYRFSIFNFEALMQKLGGILPPNFYAYHFDVTSPKYQLYQERLEPLCHEDGIALGAFPHSFIQEPLLKDDTGIVYHLVDGQWARRE